MNALTGWAVRDGEHTLRLDYPLNQDSIVFDLGGYKGAWSESIFNKYGCNIYIFEPLIDYAWYTTLKFLDNKKIHIFSFGLEERTYSTMMGVSRDASSIYRRCSYNTEVKLVAAADFLNKHHIEHIDLMKISIEGGEYALLEHLIDINFISKIDNIQVKFHGFIKNAEQRMAAIQANMSKTHFLTYQFKFVWENWKRKPKED